MVISSMVFLSISSPRGRLEGHTKRAEYGEQIVNALSSQLTAEYGRDFGRHTVFRMIQFAEFSPDEQIVSALSTQLGWSHFVELYSGSTRAASTSPNT
jgi:hypothetical protein